MRERLKRLKKNKDGFTLVELIVVLVILAILMGMLVPSLTGYIDMAHEKTALVECRQAVLAAQVKASEEYGKGNTAVEFNLSEIKELSEVPGTINKATAGDGKVTYLKYTSKRGIVVIYENGEYRIEGKDETSGGGDTNEGDGTATPDNGSGTEGGENIPEQNTGLEYNVGDVTFVASGDMKEMLKANGGNGVSIPKGIYKADGEIYYVSSQIWYTGLLNQGGIYKLDTNEVKPYVGQPTVQVGEVYIREGKYYVAIDEAAKTSEPPAWCWGEIFPKQ